MDWPDHIEKRVFTCRKCKYSVQVYGESYFDSGCHNYMATFECRECQILFENLISKIELDEVKFEAHHDLAEYFECLRCGNKMATVWNKGSGKCPKCDSEMKFEVMGSIRVKFSK